MRLGIRHVLLGLALASPAVASRAATSNVMLASTMDALAADVDQVSAPAKAPDPADVTDDQVLAGIVRARTAAFQLQLVIDRRAGEMLPASVAGLPADERAKKLGQMADLLTQARDKVTQAETELQTELPKLPENRSFSALAKTLGELGQIVDEAHKIFR